MSSQGEKGDGGGGGTAGSGGFDFQARALAYVAVHVVAGRRLDWLDDCEDIPVAVAAETGGPGDDIQIEFPNGLIEVQVKRGLDRTGLREAVRRFARSLAADPAGKVILVVDDTSSATIRQDLRVDLRRIAQGRRDHLRPITKEVVSVIAEAGNSDPYSVAARMHVVELPLEAEGAAYQKVALGLLREVFQDEDHRRAWCLLVNEGHRLQKQRGRRDRPGLLGLLTAERVRFLERVIVASTPASPDTQPTPRGETVADASGSPQTDPWQRRIDDAVTLIKAGQAGAALRLLEQMEAGARRANLPARIFYRLYTNLAACRVDLNQLADADAVLRKALDYEEADTTARGSLAQVLLAREDRVAALQLAKQVLEREPESVTGWSVLIQASDDEVGEQAIPGGIRQDFQILAARALSAYRRGDRGGSIGLLKGALQRKRDPQVLVLLSQALFAVGIREDIERYLDEAIDALSKTDSTHLLEQALLLRGGVLTERGEHERAKPVFERALNLQGHSWKVEAAVARNRLALGGPERALAILEGVQAPERQTEISLLRAFANARLARPEQARRHIEDVLNQAADAEEQLDTLLGAAEAALHAGLEDMAESVLDRVGEEAPDFRAPLLRARLRAGRGDSESARAAYNRALEMAPAAQKGQVQFELGEYLERLGEHEAAVAAFEQGGVTRAPEGVRRDYARALYQAGEASRVRVYADHSGPREAPRCSGGRNAAMILSLRYSSSR